MPSSVAVIVTDWAMSQLADVNWSGAGMTSRGSSACSVTVTVSPADGASVSRIE